MGLQKNIPRDVKLMGPCSYSATVSFHCNTGGIWATKIKPVKEILPFAFSFSSQVCRIGSLYSLYSSCDLPLNAQPQPWLLDHCTPSVIYTEGRLEAFSLSSPPSLLMVDLSGRRYMSPFDVTEQLVQPHGAPPHENMSLFANTDSCVRNKESTDSNSTGYKHLLFFSQVSLMIS